MILHWDAAGEAHARVEILTHRLSLLEARGVTDATAERVALWLDDAVRPFMYAANRQPTQEQLDDATVTTIRACWRAERWIFARAFAQGRALDADGT